MDANSRKNDVNLQPKLEFFLNPYYGNSMFISGYSMEIVWIYYGFSGAIANFILWISQFFPVE
jgi:hypothetical protein